MFRIAALAGLAIALTACGDDTPTAESSDAAETVGVEDSAPPPVRDVEYFLANREELDELFAECRNNPGELGDTPECINVLDAHAAAMRQDMQDYLRSN